MSEKTTADYDQLIAAAEQRKVEAHRALTRAEDRRGEIDEAIARSDETTETRLRKAIRDARQKVIDAQEDLDRWKVARAETARHEDAVAAQVRWKDSADFGADFVEQAVRTQSAIESMTKEVDKLRTLGVKFYQSLPTRPDFVENYTLLTVPENAARACELQIFASSGGALRPRGLVDNAWTVGQGPDLTRKAQESVQRVLARRPAAVPTSPEAA